MSGKTRSVEKLQYKTVQMPKLTRGIARDSIDLIGNIPLDIHVLFNNYYADEAVVNARQTKLMLDQKTCQCGGSCLRTYSGEQLLQSWDKMFPSQTKVRNASDAG